MFNSSNDKMQILTEFWKKLSAVKALKFSAESKENSGWNGRGQGQVVVTKADPSVLVFNEKGTWRSKDNQEIAFSNVFRWTLDRSSEEISLEHLRRGPENPVFLFRLAPSTLSSLSSVEPHLCGNDSYFGKVQFNNDGFKLSWRVIGPKKNEAIESRYF